MTGWDYACRASELADALTDAELFVLMACERIEKGARSRIFARRALKRKSVTLALAEIDAEVADAIHGLLNKGFLNPIGRRKLQCTTNGDLVKHTFNELRDTLKLQSWVGPGDVRSVEFVPKLREEMARICEEGS